MFPFFHIFLPLGLLEVIIHIFPKKATLYSQVTRFWLCIGSLLPDLIDKPLSLISQSTSGRGIGHAPLFTIPILMIFLLLTKKKSVIIPLICGNIIHLLLDIPEIPWFWPFIPLDVYVSDLSVWLYTLLHDSFVFWTEILSFIGLFVLIIYYRIIFFNCLLNRKKLKEFLFAAPQMIKNFKNNM